MEAALIIAASLCFMVGFIAIIGAKSVFHELIGVAFLIMSSIVGSSAFIVASLRAIYRRMPLTREERHRRRLDAEANERRYEREMERRHEAAARERQRAEQDREMREERIKQAEAEKAERERRSKMPDLSAPLPDPPFDPSAPSKPLIKPPKGRS